jgi:peptide/nickel transport system substrate-binding protein
LEGLAYLARDGRTHPRLAEGWTESADGLTWTIRLRRNAFFHDGSPVDSGAVRESLERSLKSSDRDYSPGLADIVAIETPGPHELLIRVRNRSTFLIDDLGVAITKRNEAGNVVGTGPFVTTSTSESEVVMTALQNYYRGTPAIDRVTLKSYPTLRTAWAAMMRGEVDFLYEVGPEVVEFVQGESSLTVFRFLRNYAYGVILNSARQEFSSPEVRRALNYAIDRAAIVRQAFREHGVAASGPAWPEHWAFDSTVPTLSHDPVRATALLESAKLRVITTDESRPPSRLRFTCLVPENFSLWERMGLLAQRNLAEVGVDMQLQTVPVIEFNKRIASGDFDAVLTDFIVGNSPTRPYFFWHSRSKLNTWKYNNAKVDEALDRIRQAANETEYRAAFRDFQLQTLDDPPAIFLALGETSRAVSKRFQVIAPPGTDILPTIAEWQLDQTLGKMAN